MRSDEPARQRPMLLIMFAVPLLTVVVLMTGIGMVALIGRRGDDTTWSRWSSVGEAFGVVNSVVSAIAVAAVVITWSLQRRDLRDQRVELAMQRQVLEGTEAALRRSADVDVRRLHVTLIGMALDNRDLADVWPSDPGTDAVTRSQHLYSNLLLQHVWVQYTAGVATREEMVSNLRYLFASPKVRAFWRDTANNRQNIYVESSAELSLAVVADTIWREYEAVLSCSDERADRERGATAGPSPRPGGCLG
ncbi:DUF6082 family protein [Actinoplanes sp. NPDC049596]|uniref:DUF6082 family protein n=1 Tax=unclassified Actinoplanes TaxID=2626549 RepID=UPI00343E9A89